MSNANTPEPSHSSLKGFWSLFITQFQGAFSDNVFKFLVVLFITSTRPPGERDKLISVALAMFAVPFVIFSMAAGYLADRFSKRTVIVWTKVVEIGIMIFGTVGLLMGNVPFLLAVIFLMSTQSAFFGPCKYGSLPELLTEKRLSWGNGIIGFGTFVAIIIGGVTAGFLHEELGEQRYLAGFLLVALAGLGLGASLGIPRLREANPAKELRLNPLGDVWQNVKSIGKDRVLALAVAGSAYFWFIGALFGEPAIMIYSQDVLKLQEKELMILRAMLAVGIGLGSAAAGFLSGKKIEYGLVPLGALGLSVCAAVLGLIKLTPIGAGVVLALLGFAGGFFIVPINALIQHRPNPEDKGSIVATNLWLSAVGVALASGAFYLLRTVLKLEPATIFTVGAVVTAIGTAYAIKILPDALLRFALWCAVHTLYRVRVLGRDNIPSKGGALFVCNHVSFVDAVLMLASTDRQVRFIMFKGQYEQPWIKPFAKILGVIPISSEQRPRELIQSLQTASDAIRAGEVVCIFAEGQITRVGHLLPFRRGFERIMKDVEAPVIPVGIDGVWGSIFSFDKGRFLWKLPRRLPYPVTINYGRPLAHTATPMEVRSAVQELLVEAWQERKARMRPLPIALVNTARKYPLRCAVADAQSPRLNFISVLIRSVLLARRLRNVWANQKMVGLLLPPSVPGALVNYAALMLGKVPVNLNYTVSEETLASCIKQCGITTVISSKTFLSKVKLKVPCELVLLEEVMGMGAANTALAAAENASSPGADVQSTVPKVSEPALPAGARRSPWTPPSLAEKLTAILIALIVPDRWIQRVLGAERRSQLDDLVTVIFSSGSTGDPKGVMLSHYNVGSNVEQLEQVFGLNHRDRILGILPFFHSFGFMGTLTLPAMLGVGVVYHPNPLDGKTIGQLVRDHEVTFLLATPTFLQIYMRGCGADDFGSLRVVMTGAEKLPDRLSAAFEEQFGIRPLEGYGCTECAPAVAVNTLDFRSAGFRQVGGKRGKIGHPLPGVSVRIVDPQTMEPVPVGQSGLMLVKGPNVMQGYLGKPEKTAEVLISKTGGAAVAAASLGGVSPQVGNWSGTPPEPAGEDARATDSKWYVTGDIAAIDEDGFLQITDRLSRFSKIGGEMVPHIKVEEKLHELAGSTEQTFVVAGVPDEKKGERLVVLHKLSAEKLQPVLEKLTAADLPNLWKPRADQFFQIEAFPYLGTGKLDLRKIKELAAQSSSAVAA